MATNLKNVSIKPSAATLTTLYTCPSATQAAVSSIVVCNQSSVATTFRVALLPLGATNGDAEYLYYDVPIAGNDTFIFTIGVTMIATDVIKVYSTLATVSFNIFLQENS